ncbi:MAG: ABC transporter ATP-binding protein [Alphaproteobacteria bacterium]
MTLKVKIKEKSYLNKHDNSRINVLKNVNFNLKSNEFVCIVGPSGCGKTTLMNMIGGIISLDQNQVEIINQQQKEENFGYVFQTSRLLPWLTVMENIELVCEHKKIDKKKIFNLLESFGLKDFINFYPKSISGGMRRKVALARALVNDPSILLMDEPFVSLDQPTSENLYKVLINYKKKNPITVIFITHVLKEALLLGDRILFFSKKPGTIVFDYKVNSKKKPLTLDNIYIDKEYKVLKTKHPQLLQGLI